jgi:hypothetical protein
MWVAGYKSRSIIKMMAQYSVPDDLLVFFILTFSSYRHRVMLTFIRKSMTRTHLCTGVFPYQKVCFLLVLILFFFKTHSVQRCVYVMSPASSSSDNNGGRDHIIGFRMSSDEITAYSIQYTFRK